VLVPYIDIPIEVGSLKHPFEGLTMGDHLDRGWAKVHVIPRTRHQGGKTNDLQGYGIRTLP